MLHLFTTIERADEYGDLVEHDVRVEFTAKQTAAASRACWDDPGWAAEYDITFDGAEFDGRFAPDGKLTAAELATLRTWFATKGDAASEAANDNRADWS
jgi:hypothetical protein